MLAAAFVVACLLLGACAAPADEIAVDLSFDPAAATFAPAGSWDLMSVPDTESLVVTGAPVVPVRQVRVAIPPGYDVASVRTELGIPVVIPGEWRLLPGPVARPVSLARLPSGAPMPNPAIYRSTDPYPGEVVSYLGTGSLSGYRIADLQVSPAQYVPATGQLCVYPDVRVVLDLTPSDDPGPQIRVRSPRSERLIREAVQSMVANPEDVPDSAAQSVVGSAASGDVVDYLVIVHQGYATPFEPLVKWKNMRGVRTEMVTSDWIYNNYSGRDSTEQIRNCIKDYWQNKGLTFVLIAADSNKIPIRRAYARSDANGRDLPSDLYYSDLDGDWNADGDSYWGEHPSDDIDMYADVYVGRAPIATTVEANRFVDHVLQYEGEPSKDPLPIDFEIKMLMLASMLDEYTDTKILMDMIDTQSVPDHWELTKLCQSEGNLNLSKALTQMEAGHNLILHDGHGSEEVIQVGPHYMGQGDIYYLENQPRFSFMYSIGCYTCNIPYDDSFGEVFSMAPAGAGFYVGNSHYGWYYVGMPANGLSGRFARYYYYALFNDGCTPAGITHGHAKDYGVGAAKRDDTERYCLYELNYMGDPEAPIWTELPTALSAEHPATVYIGAQVITVMVYDGEGDPLPFAQVCLSKEGQILAIEETNMNGCAWIRVDEAQACTLDITATFPNALPYCGTIEVVDSTAVATPVGFINAGWNWISLPLVPDDGDPASIFGYENVANRLYAWDPVIKTILLYPDDFTVVECGQGYTLLASDDVEGTAIGRVNSQPFGISLPSAGWTWIGHPFTAPVPLADVTVKNNTTGVERTAAEDIEAADPWLNWNFLYWNPDEDGAEYAYPDGYGADDDSLRPWYGYRVWSEIGDLTLTVPVP